MNRTHNSILQFHLDFDQKSSNGGWANNAISFKRNKACSTLKSFFKKKYWKNFWFPDSFACPVSPVCQLYCLHKFRYLFNRNKI